MIQAISIVNHLGESLRLPLFEPEESGFIITSIEGLGPVKANINFTELATSDGAVDNSARLESRNIVLNLKFLEDPTIEDTRLKSYKYFPVKRNVTLYVETDNRFCMTTGRIESNDPAIFDEQEGCQVSILCPYPYFYAADEEGNQEMVFYGTEPLFEFPFSNESLEEPLLEFGNIVMMTEGTIHYDGDADVGINISIHAIGPVEGLKIYNSGTREIMSISHEKLVALLGDGIKAGDVIKISTIQGQKGISLIRGGAPFNILNALEKPIGWFKLTKGDNTFAYVADVGLENLQFTIESKVIYEGV